MRGAVKKGKCRGLKIRGFMRGVVKKGNAVALKR